ncbi:MAG: imidazoleglycerol-phosphate dehydratase HisB [bacterium]
MSKTRLERKTNETNITLEFDIRGEGQSRISTGIGFFNHMLELFAFHGCFDLNVKCQGDLHVDAHHTVEDVGIVLGQAFHKALSGEQAIVRYATAWVPMDESLARAAVDISGRPFLAFDAEFRQSRVGDFDTELTREFFQAFVTHAGITLHLKLLYGANTHHKIEALFKAVAVALRQAVQLDKNRSGPASTKGVLI